MNKNFMHTTDGGITWSEFETDHSGYLNAMDILSDHVGYVVSERGELLKTTNAGASWDMIASNLDSAGYSAMQFLDENTGFILSFNNEEYRTTNGGLTWESMNLDMVFPVEVCFTDPLHGWICGQDQVFYTNNGGDEWLEIFDIQATNFDNMITDFFALDTANAWICTADGRVFTCSAFVGLKENEMSSGIRIYPNPVKDAFTLEIDNPSIVSAHLSLFSFEGKLVLKKRLYVSEDGKALLDISFLPAGIYFVRINGEGFSFSEKMLKM